MLNWGIGIGLVLLIIVYRILKIISEDDILKSFEKDLRESVLHSQPDWDEIKDIAASREVSKKKLFSILIKTKREILTGRDKELEPHKSVIVNYLSKFNEEEPFEGMPDDLKVHLQRIRDKLVGNEALLDPLTAQINELLSINAKERRQQKNYTIIGVFVGVAGLVLAIYTYLYQSIAK